MKEESGHQIGKQLKMASNAIDFIKISQRTQHTSIKEALKKILRCVSMIEEQIHDLVRDDLKNMGSKRIEPLKTAEKIPYNSEKEDSNDSSKSKS